MYCEIDYCKISPTQTMRVETDGAIITLRFCKKHALDLQARLNEQLGIKQSPVNLYQTSLPGTIGDLQKAIDYLDGSGAIADT